MNYNSYCTEKRKTKLIRTLCDRALKICSKSYLDAEQKKIYKIFLDNGYPEHLVRRTIKQRLESSLKIDEPRIDSDLQQIAIKLPFLENNHNE